MEQVRIIGRGTWLDRVASEVIEREKTIGRDLSLVRVESGLGASGLPHIGSVGDAIRSFGIKLALEGLGYKSELIAFSDDLDGLRKVPAGFPDSLNDYIAHPVTRVPDTLGCHKSFGEHVGSLLRSALDQLGVQYTFMSGAEVYRSGILNKQIKTILDNAELVGSKIKELTGQDKYTRVLPYNPICKNCGRLYTPVVTGYDSARGTVQYECEGAEIRDRIVKGCGYEGERSITEGEGKLVWKTEFAARWAALDIRFEAYGKDIADSVRVNDWICENILKYPPPYHAKYELFQDKSGRKIAKSVGNVLTPQEWLTYASPESLRLLMFKRMVGARNVSLDDIPTYMDEFDELEEKYFSVKKDPNVMKDAKLRGLYEYSVFLVPPPRPGPHVPYRLLAELAESAPQEILEEYVTKRLITYNLVREGCPELARRIRWASEWAKRNKPSNVVLQIDPKVAPAIKEFAEHLVDSKTPDEVQAVAFESMRKFNLKATDFFPALYTILLGARKGPRLGPYVVDAGPKNVSAKIGRALGSKT
jgi:lysyl-tRNA synthetase class 1